MLLEEGHIISLACPISFGRVSDADYFIPGSFFLRILHVFFWARECVHAQGIGIGPDQIVHNQLSMSSSRLVLIYLLL